MYGEIGNGEVKRREGSVLWRKERRGKEGDEEKNKEQRERNIVLLREKKERMRKYLRLVWMKKIGREGLNDRSMSKKILKWANLDVWFADKQNIKGERSYMKTS